MTTDTHPDPRRVALRDALEAASAATLARLDVAVLRRGHALPDTLPDTLIADDLATARDRAAARRIAMARPI